MADNDPKVCQSDKQVKKPRGPKGEAADKERHGVSGVHDNKSGYGGSSSDKGSKNT